MVGLAGHTDQCLGWCESLPGPRAQSQGQRSRADQGTVQHPVSFPAQMHKNTRQIKIDLCSYLKWELDDPWKRGESKQVTVCVTQQRTIVKGSVVL